MKVIITSMNGTTHAMELPNRQTVEQFIAELPTKLNKNHRVKVTCDMIGLDGYVQGNA